MARGRKTGGRQRGTPNKTRAQLDAKLAEVALTAGLPPPQIANMTPLEVMLYAMRHELECGQVRSAASIAEKAAPYVHCKMAPRAEDSGGEVTIVINGGLPR
jgi:hypothetical protein